jgi:hypothetical protein
MSKKPDELNMDQLDSASGGAGNGAPAGDLADVRLQTVMDQRSKAFETLSNILKKISGTASQIAGNLK